MADSIEADETPSASHSAFEYLATYSTQIACVFDANNQCNYISYNFKNLTGVEPTQRLGEAFFSSIEDDYVSLVKEKLQSSSASIPTQLQCKLLHADGKGYWYQCTFYKNALGSETVCIIENIHKEIQTQNTLQRARLEAELALRARSEFLANMSHDLRTPLNAVIGFSEIIQSQILGRIENKQYLEYIHHIRESGYDLLGKIEDLLEISNIDTGNVSLSVEKFWFSDIVKYVRDVQAHHLFASQLSISFTPIDQDMVVYADRLKLQHILSHLVANAIKHTQAGGNITVSACSNSEKDLSLIISDNGAGMDDVQLNHIRSLLKEDNCWLAQHQHHSAVEKNAPMLGGIGLGLALTKEFVTLHGGVVQIDSTLGKGTTIEIILPQSHINSISDSSIGVSGITSAPHSRLQSVN